MSADQFNSVMLIKKDAIDEGIHTDIVELIDSQPDVSVISQNVIQLTQEEVITIYEPELQQDPSERREILMAMAATAMAGSNLLVGVSVRGVPSPTEAFGRLNGLKGSIRDTPADGTIRGMFPHPRPATYESLSFWFKSPFFILNRVHVPDSIPALRVVESVAATKNIPLKRIYAAADGRSAS